MSFTSFSYLLVQRKYYRSSAAIEKLTCKCCYHTHCLYQSTNVYSCLITECSTEWTQYESFCYKAYSRTEDWENARKECLHSHSDLASISSSAENDFIATTLIPGEGGHWIGLNDKEQEGVFKWSDGTPYNFSSFGDSDTSKGNVSNCVVFNDRGWGDKKCSRRRPYICKKRGEKNLIKQCYNTFSISVQGFFYSHACSFPFNFLLSVL